MVKGKNIHFFSKSYENMQNVFVCIVQSNRRVTQNSHLGSSTLEFGLNSDFNLKIWKVRIPTLISKFQF